MRAPFHPDWIVPDWPLGGRVRAVVTTRAGGVSQAPYSSLNLGPLTDDDPAAVAENLRRVAGCLPAPPRWLHQVHGTTVVDADAPGSPDAPPAADAAVSRRPGTVCAVKIADCMPVLLADAEAGVIGAAHAGWRGLAGGVIEATLAAMGCPPERVHAWLGPAIGPAAFEVGADVRDAFLAHDAAAASAFVPLRPGKWLADLFALGRMRLAAAGVSRVYGGGLCTHTDPARFYSHRRDRVTGRMAALIWIEP